MAIQSLAIIIFVLAVFLVAGVPISYAIGISALAAILQMVTLGCIRADRSAENLCGYE